MNALSPQKLPQGHQAALAALLTVVFVFPFANGNPQFPLLMMAFFIWFIAYSFFATRAYGFSLVKQFKKHQPLAFAALLVWLLVSLLSYAVNTVFADVPVTQKVLASMKYIMDFAMLAYAFSLARLLLVSRLSPSAIFSAFMWGNMVLVLLLLVIYHTADMPPGYGENWSVKPPLGVHARVMGMMALVSALVAVVLFLFGPAKQRFSRLLQVLCLVVAVTFMVWTGSRASVAVFLLGMLLLLLLAGIYRKAGMGKLAVVVFCFLVSLPLSQLFSVFEWTGLQRAIAVTVVAVPQDSNAAGPAAAYDGVTSGRMTIWKVAINGFMRSPWIGLGPYGYIFIPEATDTGMYDHPHNTIIQFLVEWGVLGGGALLLFLACLAWAGLQRIPQAIKSMDVDYLMVASIVFALTLNGMLDGTYFVIQPLFCLVTAFAAFPFLDRPMRERFRASLKG